MPSENALSPVADRRTRKRDARRDALLDLAADLVDHHGVAGVTMTALAEAADYAPASLYTYFSSRSALLAALQDRALRTLGDIAETELATWDALLTDADVTAQVAALARLCAFSDLFLAAPQRQPREFKLQQQLLSDIGVQDPSDAATVLPAALLVLDVPRRLLAGAVEEGALGAPDDRIAGDADADGAYVRTVTWVSALNGILLVDTLTVGLPTTSEAMGTVLTDALLRGWGADATLLATARDLAERWVR